VFLPTVVEISVLVACAVAVQVRGSAGQEVHYSRYCAAAAANLGCFLVATCHNEQQP
jgi:hypothetical protein